MSSVRSIFFTLLVATAAALYAGKSQSPGVAVGIYVGVITVLIVVIFIRHTFLSNKQANEQTKIEED